MTAHIFDVMLRASAWRVMHFATLPIALLVFAICVGALLVWAMGRKP